MRKSARLPGPSAVRSAGVVAAEIGDDWFSPFLETYRVEMQDFLASVDGGEARGPSAWDGYAAQAVVAAATESARSGGAVAVDLALGAGLIVGVGYAALHCGGAEDDW